MEFVYFWTILFVTLFALGWWKVVFAVSLWRAICYLLFDYDERAPPNNFKVCIVGAGYSGIGMAIKLKKIGIDYMVYETAPDVGGTWYSNIYPGCACDIQSHLYSYSFEPNPFWTRKYPPQEEIQEYMRGVVRRNRVKIQYNTRVESTRWDNIRKEHTVTFEGGKSRQFNAVVYGAGALREPLMPTFEGMDDFKGTALHSALWDKTLDVTGKRVAVVGTGASAVQIVPTIAGKVDQLFVFQRTPCWSAPRHERAIPDWAKWLFNYIPGVLYLYRLFIFSFQELLYSAAFRTNSVLLPFVRGIMVKYIRETVKNPELAKKLTPDFTPGCKRITPSDEYMKSYNLDNVHLVTSKIDRITPDGIKTVDGAVTNVDIIIYATGYNVIGSFVHSFDMYNGDGGKLNDIVLENPTAYLGITVPWTPNLFLTMGPHTGLGHNSIIWMIECEINYIADCMRCMLQENARAMHPREERLQDFGKFVARYMKNKVFAGGSGCLSWYLDKNGVNYSLWPSSLPHYWWLTRGVDLRDYVLEK